MNFISIEVVNFVSYEHFFYCFQPKSILVQGINKTDENQESNGTGKTGFQAALEYSIYGNTSQKVRDKDLIRFGQNEATLKLVIECTDRHEKLTIIRTIRRTGASKVELLINDKKLPMATVSDGNNLINEWFGISKEDLQNYYIINNKRYRSFFYSSNTDKIQLIGRFSNAHLIDGVIPTINTAVAEIAKDIDKANLEKAKLQGVVETLQQELANTSNKSFEENKTQLLHDIKTRISDKEKQKKNTLFIIESEKENLNDYDTKILNIQTSIKQTQEQLDQIQIDPHQNDLQKNKRELSDLESLQKQLRGKRGADWNEFMDVERTLALINSNLLEAVKCPKCHFEFFPGDEFADLQLERGKKDQVELTITTIKNKIELADHKLAEISVYIEKNLSEHAKYQSLQDKINAQLLEIRSLIKSYEFDLTQLESEKKMSIANIEDSDKVIDIINEQVKLAHKEYEEAEKSQYDRKVELSYLQKIRKNNKLIKQCEKHLLELNQSLQDTMQWILNFKSFKAYLANQFLSVIEGLSNQFLEKLHSDIQVKWEGYKMKADGSMSEKITPYILRQGEDRDFNSFSGGERARMEFALILTIRELINQAHPYGGLQFMFADEIFEGLDGLGLSHLMKAISELNYPILVTTHVTDSNLYSDIMTIVKENGISRIYA